MRISTMLAASYLVAITLVAAAPAFASPVAATATLAGPARSATVVTPAGAWHCDGTACVGASTTPVGEAVAVCTGIADNGGRVTAFSAGPLTFGEPELKRCNRHVKS